MQVKITRGNGWYKDCVGAVFEVNEVCEIDGDYYVDSPEAYWQGGRRSIGEKDCVSVSHELELNTDDIREDSGKVIDLLANLARRLTEMEQRINDGARNTETIAQEVAELYDRIAPVETTEVSDEGIVAGDVVNSPSHYNAGNIETIEIIKEITRGYGDPFVSHCVGTSTKYLARAPFKHADPLEDLKKARAYVDFAIKHLEEQA